MASSSLAPTSKTLAPFSATGVEAALEQIKVLYAAEDEIRDLKLSGKAKKLHRLTHSKPLD
jgi:hypothetical protein